MKRFSHISFLFAVLFFTAGIQSALAGTDGYFEILNGSGGGFGYSGIHEAGQSGFIYSDLNGQLDVDINTVGSLLSLTNITGTLTATQGMIEITGGELSAMQPNGYASGFLNYTLSGVLNESGTFEFEAAQQCCDTSIFGGPNHLSLNGFSLWGGNNNPYDGSNLGIDLVGGQYIANPEPSTILLMGTGLLALPFLRRKKAA